MKKLFLLFIAFSIFACKKIIIVEDIDPASFRISILPVKTESFNQYKITGSMDVRNAIGTIEYGVVLGKAINPTIENATKSVVGKSKASVDFTYSLANLDTGSVFYARAYGLHNGKIEYSANQVIGKISPQITYADTTLNYGQLFTVLTNTSNISANTTIKISLNGIPLTINNTGAVFGATTGSSFSLQTPDQLSPGKYTLTVTLNNINLVYKNKVTIMEGRWTRVNNLPADNGGLIGNANNFVRGDWIYTYKAASSTTTASAEFSRFNYLTNEKVNLSPFDKVYIAQNAAVIQAGTFIHFIAGDRVGDYQNLGNTNTHYIYNTTSDSWSQEADFPGGLRRNPVSIYYNNKLFVGLGYSPAITDVRGNIYYADMWSYDLGTKTWKKMADFPMRKGRLLNGAFNIGSKIYITCGSVAINDYSSQPTKETWCYDTATDQWSQKANYPGSGEISFANFAIGSYGYVGMGETTTYNSYYGKNLDYHFYKYDPSGDKWTEVSNFKTLFSLPLSGANNTIALVGGGTDFNNIPNKSLYKFTP